MKVAVISPYSRIKVLKDESHKHPNTHRCYARNPAVHLVDCHVRRRMSGCGRCDVVLESNSAGKTDALKVCERIFDDVENRKLLEELWCSHRRSWHVGEAVHYQRALDPFVSNLY